MLRIMFCTIFVFAPVRLFLNVKIQPLISSNSIFVIAMTFDVLGALEIAPFKVFAR